MSGTGVANQSEHNVQYNQGPKGLAETYGVPLEEGERRHALYWENNKPYKMCLDALEKHWRSRGEKSIYCPTTGYVLNSRSAHSLGSLLIQHSGAIIMDTSALIMDEWLGGMHDDSINPPYYMFRGTKVLRVLYYHDELAFECDEEVAQELLEMGKESIREAGRRLQLKVPLDADGDIGKSWAQIH